jgi:hypothetical protein
MSATSTTRTNVLYTAKAHTAGGRDGGTSRTDDGRLDLTFTSSGKPGSGTNPEQLFAAGWSTCFIGAMGPCRREAEDRPPPAWSATSPRRWWRPRTRSVRTPGPRAATSTSHSRSSNR